MSGKVYENCSSCGKRYNVSLLRKKTDVYVCPVCCDKQAAHLKKRRNDRSKCTGVHNRP